MPFGAGSSQKMVKVVEKGEIIYYSSMNNILL